MTKNTKLSRLFGCLFPLCEKGLFAGGGSPGLQEEEEDDDDGDDGLLHEFVCARGVRCFWEEEEEEKEGRGGGRAIVVV